SRCGKRKRDCSVELVASRDRVYPNFVWPYDCFDPFEASIRTQTHNHLEPSYVDQISSFELGHIGVRVLLDFESSAVLLPSTNGGMQPTLLPKREGKPSTLDNLQVLVHRTSNTQTLPPIRGKGLVSSHGMGNNVLQAYTTLDSCIRGHQVQRKSCFGIWHIYATDVVSLSNHLKLTEEPAAADLKFEQGDNITTLKDMFSEDNSEVGR
nr:hypothetical protein [Tanacetum cinerariifolium]